MCVSFYVKYNSYGTYTLSIPLYSELRDLTYDDSRFEVNSRNLEGPPAPRLHSRVHPTFTQC